MTYLSWRYWWIGDWIGFRCGGMDFDRSQGVSIVLFRWIFELKVLPRLHLFVGRWGR